MVSASDREVVDFSLREFIYFAMITDALLVCTRSKKRKSEFIGEIFRQTSDFKAIASKPIFELLYDLFGMRASRTFNQDTVVIFDHVL